MEASKGTAKTAGGQRTREAIVEATARLLEERGFHGTGVAEIVAESGAPKGSVYYYFPGGKDQMAAEAVGVAGERLAASVEAHLRLDAGIGTGIRVFFGELARHVEGGGWRAGGPLLIVAAECGGADDAVGAACRGAYTRVRDAFAAKLRAAGHSPDAAEDRALRIMAALEGGILLARVWRDTAPVLRAAEDAARAAEG